MDMIEVDTGSLPQGFDPHLTPYKAAAEPFPEQGPLLAQFRFLVRFALLAPSSYNTQPWKFRLYDNGIAVFADYTRRLPVADPNSRELLMSIGAAVQNLAIAARYFGFDVRIDENVTGDAELPVAFVRLERRIPRPVPDEATRRMFEAIPKRHTNRRPFLMARVPDSILARYAHLAEGTDAGLLFSTDSNRNTQVANLIAKAERLQHADPAYRKELGDWLRPNATMKPDGMSGAAFGFKGVSSAIAPWAVKTIDVSGVRARHDARLCIEAPALCVFHSEDVVPAWIDVGETLERVLLMLTADGLQFSFFNIPIEVPEARMELREMLGLKTMPQLLLRIGYSLEKPVPSPRRPAEDCIVR